MLLVSLSGQHRQHRYRGNRDPVHLRGQRLGNERHFDRARARWSVSGNRNLKPEDYVILL